MNVIRPSKRQHDQIRDIKFIRNFTKHAEGSVLVCYGDTKVICTATINPGVPRFLKNSGQGWLTAEYGMLPRATHDRTQREATQGKQTGRTLEIQRLIGRSLRASVDLLKLGENTIHIDCDVIQADGGTRTASISGGCVALYDAIRSLSNKFKISPFKQMVAAVSVGIYKGTPILDLDYPEDSNCDTDMNLVFNENCDFIELQGTAENEIFNHNQLLGMLELGKKGAELIVEAQKKALNINF